MNDFSKEQPIAPAEMAKAEAMLTPEQRVMSRVRANILAPLDYVELSEDEVKIIRDYSDKASEAGRSEFGRLQKESPANRILQALEQNIGTMQRGDKHRDAAARNIQSLRQNLANWQSRIAEQEGLAQAQGKPKAKEEVIRQLMEVGQKSGIVGFGVDPELCSVAASTVGGDSKRDTILRELGYLPEGTSFSSFFSAPKLEGPQDVNKLMWGGKPSRISPPGNPSGDMVVGLTSDKLPGVVVNLEKWTADRVASFHFNVDSVARSTATIPAVIA